MEIRVDILGGETHLTSDAVERNLPRRSQPSHSPRAHPKAGRSLLGVEPADIKAIGSQYGHDGQSDRRNRVMGGLLHASHESCSARRG